MLIAYGRDNKIITLIERLKSKDTNQKIESKN